jgi:hypothetical protein
MLRALNNERRAVPVRVSLRVVVLAVVLLALVMSLSAHAAADTSDVAKSWTAARVFVPGNDAVKRVDQLAPEPRRPVVLYLHGCGGMNDDNDMPWARYIAGLGFTVVAPDRFAREDKRQSCWPTQIPNILDMRREELDYALQQIKAAPWADPANIFIMGFSEGADTLGETRIAGVRGVVMSSWTCGRVPEIEVAPGVPVLSILWDEESSVLRLLPRIKSTCGDKFEGREGFENLALRGKGHNSYVAPEARDAVAKFLKGHLTSAAAQR